MNDRCAHSAWWWIALAIVPASLATLPARADERHSATLAQRLSSGKLRWGGDAEGGAPFALRDPHDPRRVIGFEAELADKLATLLSKRIGKPVEPEFVQYEWATLLPGLENDDFDIIMNGYEVTPERQARVLFTRPYYVYAEQLVVRADDQRIHTLDDCHQVTVATMEATAADRLLEQQGFSRRERFAGQVEPYLDLELGRVDAVLLDTPIVEYYAAPNPKLKLTGPPIGQGFYAIALRRDDEKLSGALDDALTELIEDGALRDILRRWHLWNDDQAELARGPQRAEELRGLGFDRNEKPRTDLEPVPVVDRNVIAASAELWTFDRYAPVLLSAACVTVGLTVASMCVAVVVGLCVALTRLYAPTPFNRLALAYVEFFRGVPLLLVLFFFYFGLAHYGLKLNAVATAILAFGLTYGAYEAEVYRSAILSVAPGQWEAARALGMPDALAFRRIIFPQALRTALGPMTNDFVALFKDTSLVSVIAVQELTKEYLILARSSLKFVELGLLTAALYLCMSVPLGYLSRYLERRWGPGR